MTMNLYSVMQQAERKLKYFASQANLAARTAFIDSTLNSINFSEFGDVDVHYDLRIILQSRTKADLLRLGILSWYLPNTHRVLLQEKLFNSVKYNMDLIELEYILTSKGHMNIWLSEQVQKKGAHWLFGNFLNKVLWSENELLRLYTVKRIRNHKRHTDKLPEVRRIGVGYKDKGSRPRDARGTMYNFSLTLLHNEIIERRSQTETLKTFLEGFLS